MFIVFTSYNFDMETHAYECETKEEAVNVMRKIFWNAVRTEEEESINGLDEDKSYIDEESGYAKIVWDNGDDGSPNDGYMEINVTETEKYKEPSGKDRRQFHTSCEGTRADEGQMARTFRKRQTGLSGDRKRKGKVHL